MSRLGGGRLGSAISYHEYWLAVCLRQLTFWLNFSIIHDTSCAGKPRNMPRPSTPHAGAQLQPIRALRLRGPARLAPRMFMIDRQRLALGGSVEYGVVQINYVVT